MVKSKVKFYAVAVGRKPGVYRTWKECQAQTSGFKKALFKSFPLQQDAQAFVAQHKTGPPLNHDMQLSATSSDSGIHSSQCKHDAEPLGSSKRKRETKTGTENEIKVQKHSSNVDASLEVIIYFDGGSRGNPGVAGSGAHVAVTATKYDNPNRTATTKACSWKIREYLGNKATNNVAEYRGVLSGLKCAQREAEAFAKNHKRRWNVQVKIYGDSNLIINQLLGSNACKSPSIRPSYEQSVQIVNDMKQLANSNNETVVTISFQHVYRKDNSVADGLANEAMDQKRSWITKDPCNESYEKGKINPGTDTTSCGDAISVNRTDASISKSTYEHEDV